MAQDEKQELDRLCLAVIHERDPVKLTERVAELNAFLARRDAKLAPPTKPHTRTLPVKWSMVEPEKGVYDFSYIDHAKHLAEQII
jgi:hypothetical protein